ncbi:hypothetical protein CR161_00050 [Prosthecochloris sp. ZM]|nr:hypothetical protein CR161_00050 [Prosthecochloris sp. ZM]
MRSEASATGLEWGTLLNRLKNRQNIVYSKQEKPTSFSKGERSMCGVKRESQTGSQAGNMLVIISRDGEIVKGC